MVEIATVASWLNLHGHLCNELCVPDLNAILSSQAIVVVVRGGGEG